MKKMIFVLFVLFLLITNVFSVELGDVNEDNLINIIDALLTAQYYVGQNLVLFNEVAANVNCDDSISIIDALLIAQYYVGSISEFPGCSPSPVPNPSPTPVITRPYVVVYMEKYTVQVGEIVYPHANIFLPPGMTFGGGSTTYREYNNLFEELYYMGSGVFEAISPGKTAFQASMFGEYGSPDTYYHYTQFSGWSDVVTIVEAP